MKELQKIKTMEVGDWVRQGDVVVTRVKLTSEARDIVTGIKPLDRDADGSLAVARGEVTGHRHRVPQRACSMYVGPGGGGIQADRNAEAQAPQDPVRQVFADLFKKHGDPKTQAPDAAVVTSQEVFNLLHETHGDYELPAGDYYVTYHREYSPGELRRVND